MALVIDDYSVVADLDRIIKPPDGPDSDDAQFALASCYENGRGVERDQSQAEYWYKKAAEQGYRRAMKALKRFRKGGTPDEQGAVGPATERQLIDRIERANYDLQREYAERVALEATNRLPWHQQQAAQAEKDQEWFAAAFLLGQLLKDKPDDADLKRRRDAALDKRKPPAPMEPLPQP